MNPQLDEIAERFLKEMGFADGIDGDRRKQALENILYTLNVNIAKRLAATLNEEQLDQLDKLTSEDADAQELADWLSENVPNYNDLLEKEAQKLKEETLQMQKEVFGPDKEQ